MNKKKKFTHCFCLLVLSGALSGCHIPFIGHTQDGPPHRDVDVSNIPNAVPRDLPKSPYGNPKRYTVNGVTYHVLPTAKNYQATGIASWYGKKFHGRLTSTRERYNMFAMTAASPVLPIPSFVRVTNLRNGRSVIVKVNDRGPFAPNRILDLSYAAAKKPTT
jgi:rare lipoprotein A